MPNALAKNASHDRSRFPVETVLLCTRCCCKHTISCRDLAEMMQKRGFKTMRILAAIKLFDNAV
jgi:transposase-like protein